MSPKSALRKNGRRNTPPRLTTEHAEQSLLLQWAEYASGQRQELKLLYAIPNAGGFSGGFKANVARVAKLKAEGVKSGVPDLHLPVARGVYHSLYIEMKVGANTPTLSQRGWHDALRQAGNAVRVCYGWEQAKDAIVLYLDSGGVSL